MGRGALHGSHAPRYGLFQKGNDNIECHRHPKGASEGDRTPQVPQPPPSLFLREGAPPPLSSSSFLGSHSKEPKNVQHISLQKQRSSNRHPPNPARDRSFDHQHFILRDNPPHRSELRRRREHSVVVVLRPNSLSAVRRCDGRRSRLRQGGHTRWHNRWFTLPTKNSCLTSYTFALTAKRLAG